MKSCIHYQANWPGNFTGKVASNF